MHPKRKRAPGGGRKPGATPPRKSLTLRLPVPMHDYLISTGNASQAVQRAIEQSQEYKARPKAEQTP